MNTFKNYFDAYSGYFDLKKTNEYYKKYDENEQNKQNKLLL